MSPNDMRHPTHAAGRAPLTPDTSAIDPHVDPHAHHVDVGAAPPVTPASTKRVLTFFGIGAGVLALLLVAAYLPRRATEKALAEEVAQQDAPPVVTTAVVSRAPSGGDLQLPGTIQPLHESQVYARVSGYVKAWHADIGSVVRQGQVLADIDAPELEQEVQQAQHQVSQAHAALNLARADLERWKQLAGDSAVSREELDQKQAAYESAAANSGAAEANLRRLSELRQYTHVVAPFTGVITARNVDLGSLISASGAASAPVPAGGASATTSGLFKIAQTDTVRSYISVPETFATAITPGLAADVTVQELPGRTLTGHVARTARSLDVASRTMLTEIDIANPGYTLMPGMFATVTLKLSNAQPPLIVPASALVIRSSGTQVITLDNAAPGSLATAHLRSVQVGRDYGATVEILSGLEAGANVVTNPSTDEVEGTRVRVAKAAAGKAMQ